MAYPLAQPALAEAGPLTVAGLRSVGGFLVMLALLPLVRVATGRSPIQVRLRPAHWGMLALVGVLGHTATLGLAYWGLRSTTPTTISLLVNLAPVFVLILGWGGLKERPRPLQLAGMVLTCAGLVAFFGGLPALDERAAVTAGLGSSLAYSAGSVLSRRLLSRPESDGAPGPDSLTLSVWSAGIGGGLALWLAQTFEGPPRLDVWSSADFVLAVGCLAVLSTGLAYPIWNYSLSVLRAFERDVLLAIIPAETALISSVIFGQPVAAYQVVGLSFAIAGVLLVQLGPAQPDGTVSARR